ncbi:MAG: AAA family ATPase [Deltaproteobacteria bacterium]|nr:AAA family ATPase [Deltaproteobacteria bacterium]
MVLLTVSRSPSEHNGRCLAFLDPSVMAEANISVHDIVEIRSRSGRRALAKVAAPFPEDAKKGTIRLDRYLREAVKVSLRDEVYVEKSSAPPASRVCLKPLIDISLSAGQLASHLQNILSRDSLPLCAGSIIFASLPTAPGRASFEVVLVEPGSGVVTISTKIEFVSRTGSTDAHDHEHVPISEVTYEDVGGRHNEIKMVKELIEIPLRFPEVYSHLGIALPRGVIFHGPPGAGKTHLALAVSNEVDAQFFYINGPEIVSSQFGETETNLREIFHKAAHHTPSIILIDELDVIAPKRGETGSFTTTRTVSQLLTLLDGLRKMEGVIVIGTTNRVDSVDPAMRRPGRFDREIFLGPPDSTGRLEILRIHSRAMPLSEQAFDYLDELAQVLHGFVGADLMELCREAGLNALRRNFGDGYASFPQAALEELTVEKTDFEHALARVRPSAMREVLVTVPDVSWDDIGGLRGAKEELREVVRMSLKNMGTFAVGKIKPPSGILLHGPPGTGKSLLAQAVAREFQANFIPVKGPEIFSKWLGESEAELRYIFQLAHRMVPCIILFEQIDTIAPRRRRDSSAQAIERVVSQLLAEMDSIQPMSGIVVIGTTNRFDLIDPALLQARRFGAHILVPLPDEIERRQILSIHLRDVTLDPRASPGEVVQMLSAGSEGFSGAELESVCHRAKMHALRGHDFDNPVPLTQGHFSDALTEMKQSRIALDS